MKNNTFREIDEKQISYVFSNRNVIEITQGAFEGNRTFYAIPITNEEKEIIVERYNKKEPYKRIHNTRFVAIGNPNEPTKSILDILPYIKTKALWEDKIIKSYYNPQAHKYNTRYDHVICFENAESLWNYYKKLIMKNAELYNYTNVLIIKGEFKH